MNPKNLKPDIEKCKRKAPDDTRDRMKIMAEIANEMTGTNKTIMDLGAGLPAVSDFIRFRDRKIIKVEPVKYPWADKVFDVNKKFPIGNESIDTIIAADIMEHIPESGKFLNEIHRVLKRNGVLIISVPNAVSLRRRIGWMVGIIPKSAARADASYENDKWGDNPYMGHVRDYNISDLKDWLTKHKFDVLQMFGTGIYTGKGETIVPPNLTPISLGDEIIALCRKVD